jgi:hypothetical protein
VVKTSGNKIHGSIVPLVQFLPKLEVVDHSSTLLEDMADAVLEGARHCPNTAELTAVTRYILELFQLSWALNESG